MRVLRLTLVMGLAIAGACSDRSAPGGALSGPPVSADKIEALRKFEGGGCAAFMRDSAGFTRAMVMPHDKLPFASGPVRRDSRTGYGNARPVTMTFDAPGGTPISLDCWLPSTTPVPDLLNSLKSSNQARWRSVLSHLPKARKLPPDAKMEKLSREAQMVRSEMGTPSKKIAATRDGSECYWVDILFSVYDESNDSWFAVTIRITVCYDPPEDTRTSVYWWLVDNGFGNDPYVMLDADRYAISQLDTVAFTATYYSGSWFPYIYGWTWQPANGTSDPWTTACAGTSTTCRITIHGTGRMTFTMAVAGQYVSGDVFISASPPPDVGVEQGDVDIGGMGGGGDSLLEESGRLSGPFDPGYVLEPAPVIFATQISVTQSTAIWVDAHNSGEWVYTQGCARCGPEPRTNVELPVNYALKQGDCTDFVYLAIKNVLGGAWPKPKISTTMFNGSNPTELEGYGYVEVVNIGAARVGDIVVRTAVGAGGHAGIFLGRGVGGSIIGWANNGKPARPDRPNDDGDTGKYDFRVIPGFETKIFRPVLP